MRRQRHDFHHHMALSRVRHHDTIFIEDLEDLRVATRVRQHQLSQSISDAGWQLVAVLPQDTSQDCSRCGARVQTGLSARTYRCPSCSLVLDRDEHAAKKVLRVGQTQRAALGPPAVLRRASAGC